MKFTYFILCTVLLSFQANAASNENVSIAETDIQQLESSTCMNTLTFSLISLSKLGIIDSRIVLSNLGSYKKLISAAEQNIAHQKSNSAINELIQKKLKLHSQYRIGKAVANCIAPHVTLSGSTTQQLATTKHALSLIAQIEKGLK